MFPVLANPVEEETFPTWIKVELLTITVAAVLVAGWKIISLLENDPTILDIV